MKHRSGVRFVAEAVEGVGVLLLVLPTWPLSRRWLKNWGSTRSEQEEPRPGDGLVAPDHDVYTRGIDVQAPPGIVWSWVVQFGLGRAGFYSYELFERLLGIPVRNVEEIVPEFQQLSVGDEIRLHPRAPGIPVAVIEPNRHVCFGRPPGAEAVEIRTDPSSPKVAADEESDPVRSWSMYISEDGPQRTRLLLRGCVEPPHGPTVARRIGLALEEAVDFVMEQRMLRTIKRLAESDPQG